LIYVHLTNYTLSNAVIAYLSWRRTGDSRLLALA